MNMQLGGLRTSGLMPLLVLCLFLSHLAPAVAQRRAVPAQNRTCDGAAMPAGLYLQEWMRLGGPAGPMGCPVTPVFPHDSSHPERGGSITFQNGQISYSPEVWENGIVGAYQDWDGIVVDWTVSWDEPFPPSHYNYDKFLVRWDKNAENVGQADIFADMSADQIVMLKYKEETHLRTKGTFRIKPEGSSRDGIYTVQVEGCDMASKFNPLSTSTCLQGWLHPVSLLFRFDAATSSPPPGHLPLNQFALIDLTHVQPATTVVQAKASFNDRAAAAVLFNACQLLPHYGYRNEENYGLYLRAKLAFADYFDSDRCPGRTVNNRDEAIASLLRQHVESKTGTTVDDKPGFYRTGDYDVLLSAYVPIAYRYGSVLPPQVLNHLIDELLSERGALDKSQLSIPGFTPETENHVMLIESARYLTNQLLFARTQNPDFDNSRNGMDEWMLRHLQRFLQVDFIEYNSKPYQDYTMAALLNLTTYAWNQLGRGRVQTAAEMVLDYVSAKVAVSSNDARRVVPYRRRVSHNDPNLIGPAVDPQTPFFMMLAGVTEMLPDSKASSNFGYEIQLAGLSSYRVPDLILDLFVSKEHRVFYQAFHHAADEIYAGSPGYLISAGGHYATFAYLAAGLAGSHEDIGLALPTTLMPSGAIVSRNELLRFDGDAADDQRSNMCVAPDFACGLNPVIPRSYTEGRASGCVQSNGPWTLLNQTGACAAANTSGHYIAMYKRDGFGFLEAYDLSKQPFIDFNAFTTGVIQRNAATPYDVNGVNTYVTTSGHKIDFRLAHDSMIVSIDNKPTGAPGSTLAWGSILNSEQDTGLVVIDNPSTKDRLVLDFRNASMPIRTLLPSRAGSTRHVAFPVEQLLLH